MAGIFISYRRADSQIWADQLADSLILRFGGGLIWRDVDDIPAGEPWSREIRRALAAADAVLVLIGPDWLGNPRLAERRDVLRHEIETALRSRASVVPVLVGGAGIPERSKAAARHTPAGDSRETPSRHLARGMALARRRERFACRAAPNRWEQAEERTPQATLRKARTVSERLFLRAREARSGA